MSSEVTVGKGKGFLNPHFKISTDVGQSCWPYPKHRSQHQNRSLDDTASQSWCVIRTFSDATLKASRIKSPCFLFAKVLQGKWPKAMTTMTWSRILYYRYIYIYMTYHHLHISLGARFLLEMGCDFLLTILCHVHDMKGPFSSNFQPMWVRFRGSSQNEPIFMAPKTNATPARNQGWISGDYEALSSRQTSYCETLVLLPRYVWLQFR